MAKQIGKIKCIGNMSFYSYYKREDDFYVKTNPAYGKKAKYKEDLDTSRFVSNELLKITSSLAAPLRHNMLKRKLEHVTTLAMTSLPYTAKEMYENPYLDKDQFLDPATYVGLKLNDHFDINDYLTGSPRIVRKGNKANIICDTCLKTNNPEHKYHRISYQVIVFNEIFETSLLAYIGKPIFYPIPDESDEIRLVQSTLDLKQFMCSDHTYPYIYLFLVSITPCTFRRSTIQPLEIETVSKVFDAFALSEKEI